MGPIEIKPQPGPQTQFLSSEADIAIFGGSAGGGKTFGLLLDPLRHYRNSLFGGVIFRRTNVQIKAEGGLWDTSMTLYPLLGAEPSRSVLEWKFPTGMSMSFANLEHEKDALNYQGSQIAWCLGRGTLIKMGDESLKPIESIKVGDLVQTLQGPRRVTKTHSLGKKDALKVTFPNGESVFTGEGHQVLSPSGAWVDLSSYLPNQSRAFCSTPARSPLRFLKLKQLCESIFSGLSRVSAQFLHSYQERGTMESGAFLKESQNDCGAFGDGRLKVSRPQEWCATVALLKPHSRLRVLSDACAYPRRAFFHAYALKVIQDFQNGYHALRHSYGVLTHRALASSPSSIPLQDGVGGATFDLGREFAHLRSRAYQSKYSHPYTNAIETTYEVLYPSNIYISPSDEQELFDLTVESVSHYITSQGLISKNCGFDELTHFTWNQFSYLISRNRSMSGAQPRIRATCNPDPDSWVRDFIDWWIDEKGYAIPERSGVLRYFIRISDSIHWADTKEGLHAQFGDGPDIVPKSVTFIRSKLEDNQILMKADPAYRGNLLALNRVDRERLLDGNWNARASSGSLFKTEWFPIVDEVPGGWVRVLRFWDRAATKPNETNRDPDYTRGLLLYKYPNGTYCVGDLRSMRDTPMNVEQLIKTTASHDSVSVEIMSQQDPGSAGVSEADNFIRMLAGYYVRTMLTSKDKVTRAKPASAQAERFNIMVKRAPWNKEFFSELENFPDGAHDDIVDTLSGAFNELNDGGYSIADVL